MLPSRRLRLCYALCVWGGGGFFGDDYLESAFVTFVRIAPPLRVRLGVRLHSVRPRTSLVANGAIHTIYSISKPAKKQNRLFADVSPFTVYM